MPSRHTKSSCLVAILVTLTLPLLSRAQQAAYVLERETAFQSQIDSYDYKKAVIKASLVMKVQQQYRAHKEWFQVTHMTPKYWEVEQLSENEAVQQAFEVIDEQIDGWNIRNEPEAKILETIASLLPFGGQIVQGGFALVPAKKGELPEYEIGHLRDQGVLVLKRSDQDDFTGNLIREIMKKDMGFDPRSNNYSNHQAVVEARIQKDVIANKDATKEVSAKLNQANRKVGTIVDRQNRQLDAQKIEAQYRNEKAEALGGMNAMAYGMKMLDMEKQADFMLRNRDIMSTLMDIDHYQPGPMARAGAYMGIGMQVLSMFQKGGGKAADQMILEQLMKLMELVEKVRREMHDRFDRVDAQLASILSVSIYGLSNIEESVNQLHKQALSIQALVNQRYDQLRKDVAEYNNMSYLTEIARCNDYRRGTSPKLTEQQIDTCLGLFDHYGNEFSIKDLFVGRPLGEDAGHSIQFPYSGSFVHIAKELSNNGADDLTRALSIDPVFAHRFRETNSAYLNLPHPQMWLDNSNEFIKFARASKSNFKRIAEVDFSNYLSAGEAIQEFYRGVAFDETGRMRLPLIQTLLAKYQATLDYINAQAELNSTRAISIAEAAKPHFHTGRPQKQAAEYITDYFRPNYDSGDGKGQQLQWCGKEINYTSIPDWPVSRLSSVGDPAKAELILKSGVSKLVDDRIRLYEMIGIGTITYCMEKYHSLNVNGPYTREMPLDYDFILRVQFKHRSKQAPMPVSTLRVKQHIKIYPNKWEHFHPMVWNVPNFKPEKNNGFPISEALTQPKLVEVKRLLSKEDAETLKVDADRVLEQFRNEQLGILYDQTAEFQTAFADASRLRSLLQIVIQVGLSPSLSQDQKRLLHDAFDAEGGVPYPSDAALAPVVRGAEPKDFTSQLEKSILQLQDVLKTLSESKVQPQNNPIIEKQLKTLEALKTIWESKRIGFSNAPLSRAGSALYSSRGVRSGDVAASNAC